jgi:hypothetical protein
MLSLAASETTTPFQASTQGKVIQLSHLELTGFSLRRSTVDDPT